MRIPVNATRTRINASFMVKMPVKGITTIARSATASVEDELSQVDL
jgi:hypothetical protein